MRNESRNEPETMQLGRDVCITNKKYIDYLCASMHDIATCRMMGWDLWEELESPCPDYVKVYIMAKGALIHLEELERKRIDLSACEQDKEDSFLDSRRDLIEDLRTSFSNILANIPRDDEYYWIMN